MSEIRIPFHGHVLVFDSDDLESVKTSHDIGQVGGESDGWAEYDFAGKSRIQLRFREGKRAYVERAS